MLKPPEGCNLVNFPHTSSRLIGPQYQSFPNRFFLLLQFRNPMSGFQGVTTARIEEWPDDFVNAENSQNSTRCLHRHWQKTTRTAAVLRHNSSTRYKLQRSHCLSPEASVQPASLSRSRNP